MKIILSVLSIIISHFAIAQSNFPDFLEGTWKMESNEKFEHWDKLNDQTLKGIAYSYVDGKLIVSEYLEIAQSENEISYTATVVNQNQGKGVGFKLFKQGDAWSFENPNHDFPKKIIYQKISDQELLVSVSEGKQKGFSYKLLKQISNPVENDTSNVNPNYDHELAQQLGADDYGMKSYILVILKTGSNQTTDREFISKCFRGHLDNITRLVEEGKMVVAGPLGKNEKTYRGIFILDVKTIEEAQSLLQTDMAIQEGLLDAELYPWYGSAALSEYLPASDKIWKLKP